MSEDSSRVGPDPAAAAGDERPCPFCAEPVKRAAIRCRWCQSDIPADEAPEATASPAPASETPAAPRSRPALRWPVLLAGLLAVAVVVAGVVLVRMLWFVDGQASGRPSGNSPGAEGAVVESESAKTAVLSAASEATQKVLSYSWKTLDADTEAARSRLTGEMLQQYDDTMEGIQAQTEKNQAVVEATVVSSSVISVTDTDAKVLLFVNQSTVGTHLEQPRVDLNRVVVTLQRDTGDWLISELDAL